MIGRTAELAALTRLVERAAAGASGLLVVTGPRGSGKTTLLDAAVRAARAQGVPVAHRTAESLGTRLIVIDENRVPEPAELERLLASGASVLVTAGEDSQADLRLRALSEAELNRLLPGRQSDVVHAIWLASGGMPGTALDLAALIGSADDPVAVLALSAPSRTQFLVPDVALLRLLEWAATRPLTSEVRAKVLIRWARELLGDTSSLDRRRELADEAVQLAEGCGDPGVLANVLDGRLHALWDPAAAPERRDVSSLIVGKAREAGDGQAELNGLFWRFVALVELGDLDAAEAALVSYARTGELLGDSEAGVIALSRQAVLAIARGRLTLAEQLTEQVAKAGQATGLKDTARLTASLAGQLALLRGEAAGQVDPLQEMALRLPGHFYEATAARVMAEAGRDQEAGLELTRLLPSVLAGSGPRWLGAVADLAFVAAREGSVEDARKLYDALQPFTGRLVVWGGANTVTGPVDDLLGRLANRLGEQALALKHFDDAVAQEERLGAATWLSGTLAVRGRPGDAQRSGELTERIGIVRARPDEWRLVREDDAWLLEAGAETVRVRHVRGFQYLKTLVSAPGQEIAALDLVADGPAGLERPWSEELLDASARRSFNERLSSLEKLLDVADQAGDAGRGQSLSAEREALLAELRRATGLGGRPRQSSPEAERARVNATRALGTALSRLETKAPIATAHLRASLRTGSYFRYQPTAGGPQRWRLS
ncbi:AAA family ATPase [Kineosporia babensis]|uniref:ATP-binding protein n=1 Tax=Kineosporia babensis TaxID=499548 RepID=A0A9X1NAI2_9ACTN|nr:AAA family ATPase [Kineosporia babensis]MCD5310535.1 ATP-binding protein [Kineosporia babensis]